KIVQLFSQEQRKAAAFDKTSGSLMKSYLKMVIVFGIFRPSIYFFYILGLIIVLLFGGNQVIKGYMTIGVLVVFIEYISNFFEPIQQLAEQFDVLQSAIAASEKIFTLLDEKNDILEASNPVVMSSFRGEIEFKQVWFAYNEEDWVLKDVSFTAKEGEILAFVGATGAGKTSILNLINRYYDIQKGQILIDGKDIREYELASLRRNIGQMQQDVFLFTGDIKSNIRLKNETISDEQIQEYAKYVNADGFIQKLPKGYDEIVYERGSTYSSGQRQLISFARTLASNPSILVLDEATANIDTETEILIQDALAKIMQGRTTLVVAHRLSTIQHANKIVVLHKGRIKEVGNHQDLLGLRGVYYELYELQYGKV
ncbi:MAG: ABC transporter ATP-binding protein, partial [Vallitaleaceae bacterium]|nr:ABC transporter ATP-binding protein [Vallitaleaceae bacterium]